MAPLIATRGGVRFAGLHRDSNGHLPLAFNRDHPPHERDEVVGEQGIARRIGQPERMPLEHLDRIEADL